MKIKRTIKEIFSRLKTHRSWSFILCLLILGVVSHYVSLGATQNFQDIQDNGGIQVFSRINVKSRDGGHHLGGKKRGELVLLCKSLRQSDDLRLLDQALTTVSSLTLEKDVLITKAISWVLRSAIKNHPSEIKIFLEQNKSILPRIAYRETSKKLTTGKKS